MDRSPLPCPETQQVSPGVDEGRYAQRMAPVQALWADRARQTAAHEGLTARERKHVYASRRAAALARPYGRRLQRCSRRGVVVKCGCRGKRDVRWFGCRQHLTCGRCLRSRSKILGQRVRAGLEAAAAAAPAGTMLVLVTLTTRHSGDVAADRAAIATGWRRLYRALDKRGWGKFAYVGVWEVTPGDDGLGHVHAHVACFWPFRDWSVVRRMWMRACPTSERITFVARRRDGKASNPRSAANYLGKYLSKGMQTSDFSPELRADVLAASYQARWVFTSVRFWQPWVPACPGCGLPSKRAQYVWHGTPCEYIERELDERPRQLELSIPAPQQRGSPRCA